MLDGSIWVQGDYLYIVSSGKRWRYSGTVVSTPSGAIPGSLWISGNDLYYIDASGKKRVIPTVAMSTVPGLAGSAWIEGNFLHWVGSAQRENYSHEDISHSDSTNPGYSDYIDHGNTTSYGDHSNTTTYGDHNNVPFSDHYNGDIGGHDDFNDHNDECPTGAPWAPSHVDCSSYHHNYSEHFNHTDHSNVSHGNTTTYGDHGNTTTYGDHSNYSDSGYYDSGSHNNIAEVKNPMQV